jgi:hypothetical protein
MADLYKVLTPDFRRQILDSIDKQMHELDTCEPNALVSVQRLGLSAYKSIFKALPDGYPVPITRGGRYDR